MAGFLLGLLMIASAWGAGAESAVASSGGSPLVQRIVQEMVRSQVPQLLLAALQWTLLGALLGLAAGVLGIVVARALGAYRSGWKYAGWVRWPLWVLTVSACLVCLGLWGFWRGVVQGGEQVVQKSQLDSELKRLGVDTAYHALRDRLVSEAARQGNPDTISRREISAFMVNEAIIPAVMKPIRSFAGGQAGLMLVLALFCAVVPPLGFALTCGRVKPAQQPVAANFTGSRVG